MTSSIIQRWLDTWGYTGSKLGLHKRGAAVPATHAYRNEIDELLNPRGAIRAEAVYDVDGTPTVCFVEDDGRLAENPLALERIREKIWNQNLISIVLIVREGEALALPAGRFVTKGESLTLAKAQDTGFYSCREVQSGDVFERHIPWFTPEDKVDCFLLRNLCQVVEDLGVCGLNKLDAQYLMSQVLFISYLEHREIIGETYRIKHGLGRLDELVQGLNRSGVVRLLAQLKHDFNGDFLEPESIGSALWETISDGAFTLLNSFLSQTDLRGGQQSFWRYDFRYIPVELISGIYESFLSEEKRDIGAYYTPRHLANLVVSQAFAGSANILDECVYDGACGSGILLTTAYRRMLSYAEAKEGRSLRLNERRKLLEDHIFGSDLNISACRVTAFSLYLSMLEGLQPADITELQDDENVKLPSLRDKNILGGLCRGDFFSDENPHAISNRFTIFISNPPWVEPKGGQLTSSDRWANTAKVKIPRRQMAGAFMLRARDSLVPGGRACLILPVSIIAAPTSSAFLKVWLEHFELETLINFGDLRKLLFTTAKQPCVVVVGKYRSGVLQARIRGAETFEYWVPKADVSFAFGRLTIHASDRHRLQSLDIQHDNEVLTSLFWGTARDVATLAGLRLHGTLKDLIGDEKPWLARKGFHRKDTSVSDPVSSAPLRKLRYLDAKRFGADGPVLDKQLLSSFPADITSVTRLPDDLMAAFAGPKIVFTDGVTGRRSIRAAFSGEAFSFSSSIGVIAGPNEDEALLRFVAAYLHSDLAQYALLLSAYQINFERERVTLGDIQRLPFVHPNRHTDSALAWKIVNDVAEITREMGRTDVLFWDTGHPARIARLINEYFGINPMQSARIEEVAHSVAPNLQPSSIAELDTPLQWRASTAQVEIYAKALRGEILAWQTARGGTGDISVAISTNSARIRGPLGIVRVEAGVIGQFGEPESMGMPANDRDVEAILQKLIQQQLLPLKIQENLHLAMDVAIRAGDVIYLIKPLVTRLWLCSGAYQDAGRIVRSVLTSSANKEAVQ